MRDHRSFRPSVIDLEPRRTPAHMAVLVAPHITVPVPPVDFAFAQGGKYQNPDRLATHADFAKLARQGAASSVVFLGDSLTFFWGDSQNPKAPGLAYWNADFVPLGAANFGVYGDRTENLLWRIENGELAGKPKVVVLMIGINDLTSGRTPAQAALNIGTVVRAIRAESPSTKILLEGLLPTAFPNYNVERLQVNATIAGLARTTPNLTYLDPGAQLVGADGNIQPAYTADGLHISTAGYRVLANFLIGPVRAALLR